MAGAKAVATIALAALGLVGVAIAAKPARPDRAAGQECPANSGKYCPDQFPVCCKIKGEWKCVAKLSDCHE